MLTIRYAGTSPEELSISRALRLTVHDDSGGQVATVAVALSHPASELLRVETGHIASEDIVVDALARYGVRRLETTLGDPATRAQLLGDGSSSRRPRP